MPNSFKRCQKVSNSAKIFSKKAKKDNKQKGVKKAQKAPKRAKQAKKCQNAPNSAEKGQIAKTSSVKICQKMQKNTCKKRQKVLKVQIVQTLKKYNKCKKDYIVSVLLSAPIKRFSVSRIKDFKVKLSKFVKKKDQKKEKKKKKKGFVKRFQSWTNQPIL